MNLISIPVATDGMFKFENIEHEFMLAHVTCPDTYRDRRPKTPEQKRALGAGKTALLQLAALLLGATHTQGVNLAFPHTHTHISHLPISSWRGCACDDRRPLRQHAESQAGLLHRLGGVVVRPLLRLRGAGYAGDDEEAARRRELESLREMLQQSEETLARALASEEEELEEQEEQTCIRAEREQRRRERAGETAFLRSVAIRDAERDGLHAAGASSAPIAPSADLDRRDASLPGQRHVGASAATDMLRRDDGSAACGGNRRPSRWESQRKEEGMSEANVLGSFQDSDMADMGSSMSAQENIFASTVHCA